MPGYDHAVPPGQNTSARSAWDVPVGLGEGKRMNNQEHPSRSGLAWQSGSIAIVTTLFISGTSGAVQERPRHSGPAALQADGYNRSWSRPKVPCRSGLGNFYGNARSSRSADRKTSPNKGVLPPMASAQKQTSTQVTFHRAITTKHERVPCLRDIRHPRVEPWPKILSSMACRRASSCPDFTRAFTR